MLRWIIIAIILISVIRVKKRGFFWLAKDGTELTFKQFMSRWRIGVEGITALQQSKTQLMGTWITITGIIAGIVINALIRLENMWWWIEIILVGSLILTGIQFIGTYQKYRIHKRVEKEMKEAIKQEVKRLKKLKRKKK